MGRARPGSALRAPTTAEERETGSGSTERSGPGFDAATSASALRTALGWEELLFGLLLEGHIGFDELRLLSPPVHADMVVERFRARFSPAELESLPRALGQRAGWGELLELGVSGLNCDGEDLQSIAPSELVARMKGVQRLRVRGHPSAWLARYAARLVRESRRRKGVDPT